MATRFSQLALTKTVNSSFGCDAAGGSSRYQVLRQNDLHRRTKGYREEGYTRALLSDMLESYVGDSFHRDTVLPPSLL